MKRTNFYEIHKNLGGKIVPFAGFEMPVQYPKGILHEHTVVRTGVGVFDVSHMGEFEVRGKNALAFIQQLTVNDASKLTEGKAQYSAMCYPDGGIVDDLLVYHCGDYYMLVVNGANVDKDFAWASEVAQSFDNVELINVSDDINLLAIQGPKSLDTLQKLTDVVLTDIPYYSFQFGKFADEDMIISRTGYTGEIGCEIYFRGGEEVATRIWNAIFEAGAEFDIEPIGLGARDTLRLEKGYCLYGNDIDNTTHPLEAGLGWITKLGKGDFNGKSVIEAAKAAGLNRKLVGFVMKVDKFIPRQHYKLRAAGQEIGEVTSGNISPLLNIGIGLGYVATEYAAPGSAITVFARNTEFPAEVVKIPFL
jgi:aminomethyltransferase